MDEMAVSKFKVTCPAALDRGRGRLEDDLVAPVEDAASWDALT